MNHLKFKKRSLIFGSLLTIALVATTSCNKDEDASVEDFQQIDHEQNGIPKEYIVVFKDATIKSKAVAQESLSILERYGVTEEQIAKEYTTIFKGVFLKGISPEIAEQLKSDPAVESVAQNVTFDFDLTPITQTKAPLTETNSQKMNGFADIIRPNGEVLSWAAQRVGRGDGTGKKIWIIDSGIADIDELNIDKKNSRNFVPNEPIDAWQDTHATSHGTRVASIAAAKENGKGIIGVAAGATVVAIRIVGSNANFAAYAEAFDYVAANIQPGEVWNFSAGPGNPIEVLIAFFKVKQEVIDIFERAIEGLSAAAPGFVAAGNKQGNLDMHPFVESHTSTPNDQRYIIGATTNTDAVWSNSPYGQVIDYWAPGVNIAGVDKMGNVVHGNGSSFASPMVAAMYLISNGNLITNLSTATKNNITRPIPQIIIPTR
ncbi:S8 family serine peptidase [Aquimarina aquimarini]|uniref:S8 family serine peptidase n=1 Tax=Aquimarina aquimarini TaxID=1191734 RepID=UPI001F41D856|nr:S8 family serine peptidase [Aquimarina aquimarini]